MQNIENLIDQLSSLTVMEAANLAKKLEEKWGVSAAAPVMAMAPAASAVSAAEEQTEFDVILKEAGGNKIAVIKVVRELTDLGLKEAKELVDSAPKPIKSGLSKADADAVKAKLVEAGAVVEIK